MKKTVLLILLFSHVLLFAQQTETFDLATFSPPAGWRRESVDFAASYLITNNKTGGWCRVSIYKSIDSSGDPRTDFNSEWKSFTEKEFQGISLAAPETIAGDGWTETSSAGKYSWQGKDAFFLLTSISGYGKVVSITANMNSDEYLKDVQGFLESVQLLKPEGYTANTKSEVSHQNATVSNQTNVPAFFPTDEMGKSGTQGISKATTNFDDGWVAQPFADYVRVTKGNVSVLLHYAIEITDELRNSGDVEGNLFDRLMQPRYTISNIKKFENELYCYFCIHFYEADVVEKSTGKKYYVGFRVITENGISRCIEILSPSKQEFQREFPTQEKIAALTNYNKFAVSKEDLIGTWQESSGTHVNMYNTVTGAYAGMNSASSAATFIFKSNGTYFSNHKGAFGMVGSMKFYDQKYNGAYTVTNWDITATKRFEGKTDVFWAQYEAVRGGRVLHLTDKTASGIRYSLVKTE
jgi:hypothetical protein